MSWNPLTSAQIEGRLTAPELLAITTAAKQTGQSGAQLIADGIAAVTTETRGYVAACSRNTLGPAGTIPDELESAALALLRRYLFTRLPGMKSLFDELRQKECEDALVRLRDTAKCAFAIVGPELPAPTEEQAAGIGIEFVPCASGSATAERMDGL